MAGLFLLLTFLGAFIMVKFTLQFALVYNAIKLAKLPFLAMLLVAISSWAFTSSVLSLSALSNNPVPFSHPNASR